MKKIIIYKIQLCLLALSFLNGIVLAQTNNVGIGTNSPDNSAILDLNVDALTPKLGFLVPRMTMTERGNMVAPARGLLVYQTDNVVGFYYYTGSAWVRIQEEVSGGFLPLSGGTMTGPINLNNFLLTNIGNAGTNFLTGGGLNLANKLTIATGGIDVTGNAIFASLAPGGIVKASAAGLLSAGTINAATELSGILPLANGGTGLSSIPASGQLLIGNGTGYTLSTLTAGTNISINNAAGAVTINASGFGMPLKFTSPLIRSTGADTNTISISLNSESSSGVVASGAGNFDKVWKTDGLGSPGWRDDVSAGYTAGAGISINGSNVISNAIPQVDLTATGITNITGTYPNLTINTPAYTAGANTGISIVGSVISGQGLSSDPVWNANKILGDNISTAPKNDGEIMVWDATNLLWQFQTPGVLPSGATNQTLRHDGAGWKVSTLLTNTDTYIGIGDSNPESLLQLVKPGSGNIFAASSSSATDGDYFKISNSGLVGLNLSTSPLVQLDVNGGLALRPETANTATITVGNRSYIKIDFTGQVFLSAGSSEGQILILQCIAGTPSLLDNAGTPECRLTGDWVASPDDTITLIWDGSNWIETARSNN